MPEVDLLGDVPPKPLSKGYAGRPGEGPAGKTCRDCANCYHRRLSGRRYHKCALVATTHSVTTDIRLSTPACGRFEPKHA